MRASSLVCRLPVPVPCATSLFSPSFVDYAPPISSAPTHSPLPTEVVPAAMARGPATLGVASPPPPICALLHQIPATWTARCHSDHPPLPLGDLFCRPQHDFVLCINLLVPEASLSVLFHV
eukprot:GGOE01057967.1.p2 GENE.GGOE01057967.1~~GGOE01057967.1.p2  ORF type:complete len:121 (+),score=16.03 GGOE01057967.1:197-559(+)